MEQDITTEQARAIISEHGGYGTVRVYGIIADGEECAGQMVPIKSEHHLGRFAYRTVFAKSNDGTVPIRPA